LSPVQTATRQAWFTCVGAIGAPTVQGSWFALGLQAAVHAWPRQRLPSQQSASPLQNPVEHVPVQWPASQTPVQHFPSLSHLAPAPRQAGAQKKAIGSQLPLQQGVSAEQSTSASEQAALEQTPSIWPCGIKQ
jgi:hypothetical protein